MLAKLQKIKNRFLEIEKDLSNPDVISDMDKYKKLNKDYKDLSKIVDSYHAYKNLIDNYQTNKLILEKEKDNELREMAKEELVQLDLQIPKMEEEIKLMLIPKDPNDAKNTLLEIRAGVGGDEAALFAGVLYRMYQRFAEIKGWKTELIDFSAGPSGGYKEIICNIIGENVYGTMKYESGVHRVQRVPVTEAQGRIHTSVASIVVLPEAEEFDIKIDMNEIRKDLFCSSGPGGQSVNTTYSAVRLTHIPTGTIAQCQDEKSQHRNYEKALSVLRTRLYEMELAKKNAELGAQRKSMVGKGDRSDKIRTYNYPQNRITDHRIGLTLYNLTAILEGDLSELIAQLRLADNIEKLKMVVE